MLYEKLVLLIKKMYGPALLLDNTFSLEKREVFNSNLLYSIIVLFISATTMFATNATIGEYITNIEFLNDIAYRMYGLFLILVSLLFITSSFEALYRSFYHRSIQHTLAEENTVNELYISWEVASIINETPRDDIVGGFINSSYGQEILYRLGISSEIFESFNTVRVPLLKDVGFIVDRDGGITLESYIKSIYKHDEGLRHFLSQHNITERQLVRAAQWVASIEHGERKKKRWWSRDNLGRIPGLGKTWNYGQTYILERYGHEIIYDHIWHSTLLTRRDEIDEVDEIEQILSRSRQSNVLLLSNDVLTARQRVSQLYYKIREGIVLPPIESKRIFLVDLEAIIISHPEKPSFEQVLVDMLEQALLAGNVIVYIEHLVSAITSTSTIGVDLIELLTPFLESNHIQIIIADSIENYNKHLSRDVRINKVFDMVNMKNVENDGVLDLLEQRATRIEKEAGVVFSIQALEKIGELAERYFPTGVMPDKAFDLIEEMVPYAISHNHEQILQKDVELFIKRKTNVPIGEPGKEEKDKLLHLESFLHKRIIAQDEAISAISKALRRARAGVTDPKKTLGTFLFLGPTGVGKTETAKALAEAMFNDEHAMIRLDMTEFNNVDSINELIGSFQTNEVGRLESLLRERPYGILLLDEFEKSHHTIQDLFLQILDEGYYTNSFAHKISLHNHLIIATSNAGAELIWNWKTQNNFQDQDAIKHTLIDHIINKGIMKPELLNRFDEIVLFQTLSKIQIHQVARIHLEKFAKRMEVEHNITIHITDNLVSFIAERGYDPVFGGRQLDRTILNTIEQMVADELLAGTLQQGDTFDFSSKNTQ